MPLTSTPSPVASVSKSQGVKGPSKVIKKLVQLPKDQPSDVDELLRQLKEFKVKDESYATMYFQLLAKDRSYMGNLQPPAAYNPPLVMGHSSPALRLVLPPRMCITSSVMQPTVQVVLLESVPLDRSMSRLARLLLGTMASIAGPMVQAL